MSSTARSEPLAIKYSIIVNAWTNGFFLVYKIIDAKLEATLGLFPQW
jgi:hypothetical protein